MKLLTKIMFFLGLILFIVSFFMPVLKLTPEMKLNGMETFVLNAGMLYFVDNAKEYFIWVFVALANVWAVLLFIRFWRKTESRYLSHIIGNLALASSIYWTFRMEESGALLYGYWMWFIGIALIALANIFKAKRIVNA